MNYEINFLILQSQTENADKLRNEVKKLIDKYAGKITDELIYQKRKLAYEINHEHYGFYTVYRFDLDNGENIKDLTKDLNLLKGVVRHIIVRSDELPELQKEIGKSAATTKEDQEDTKQNKPSKDGKKVLAEIDKETKEQKSVLNEVKENDTVNTTSTTKKKSEKETSSQTNIKKSADEQQIKKSTEKAVSQTDKESSVAQTEDISPDDKKSSKKDKKGSEEISMEDLDKKLDEILDI